MSRTAMEVPDPAGQVRIMAEHARFDGSRAFAVEKLDVFGVAVELLVLMNGLFAQLWRRDSALTRQLQRAVASLICNIGEAAGSLSKGDRRRYFEYAYRSASECAAALIAFNAIDALDPSDYRDARALLHRVQIMLMGLMKHAYHTAP